MDSIPKILVSVGLMLVVVGGVWWLGIKYLKFGNLPGDIAIEKENFKFYFPLGTSILISVVLSLVFWFLGSRK